MQIECLDCWLGQVRSCRQQIAASLAATQQGCTEPHTSNSRNVPSMLAPDNRQTAFSASYRDHRSARVALPTYSVGKLNAFCRRPLSTSL